MESEGSRIRSSRLTGGLHFFRASVYTGWFGTLIVQFDVKVFA